MALSASFDAVRELLKPLSYPTEAVALPSIGAEPPNKDLSDDAAHTRAAIEKLVEAGKKVVLVTHSYGGSLDLVLSKTWASLRGGATIAIDTPGNIFYHDLSSEPTEMDCATLTSSSAASSVANQHTSLGTICHALTYSARTIRQFLFHIAASHSPFLSTPDKVVEGIELAAKLGLEKSQ
ncbi:uncharacterized protein EAF01_007497 [Botrytis porri]|uniref:uncharacterized protein n=1 Tax=Botrytis porri TaxID=87229 RepID=UPI0019013A5E|nr:uncharacterized protein EAF01_007497 [Botrytis porri]KAF7902199.1 hypothetical protein EAF01_007497 [Botrytis porri]